MPKRRYIAIFNSTEDTYRLAFRTFDDPYDVYYVDTDIGPIKLEQVAQRLVDALNAQEALKE